VEKTASFRFRREERLKRRGEIREVFNQGRGVSCPGAKLFARRNTLPGNRIAFTFSRKFGNAVKRNRARRLGREAYRHLRPGLRTGYDLVLLIYPGADDFAARMAQLRGLFARQGLLKTDNSGNR
jgi:ribonuclease P protein component